MIIQFNTFQLYPFYDLFSYFCSILEIDVLYLVLFSIIIINIIYFIHNSNQIIKGLKTGAAAVIIGAAALGGKDLYNLGKKLLKIVYRK